MRLTNRWKDNYCHPLGGAFAPGLFFVAETGEISNHDLIGEMDRIIKLEEVFSIIK